MMTTTTIANTRLIGPVGTVARVAVGLAAIALTLVDGVRWWAVPLGLIVIPLAVTLGQAWLNRQYPGALRELGELNEAAACTTALIVAPLLILPYTSEGTLLWLGASMLLAAVRGYAGCEVLAISNWLLRRDDTIGCLLFTPIDEAEARWQATQRDDLARPGQDDQVHRRDEPTVD